MKSTQFMTRGKRITQALTLATCVIAFPSYADDDLELDAIEVRPDNNGLVGVANTASEGTVTSAQLKNRPLTRPAEVLEVVPGLIISQHSGEGKANQYYLRGFNLDHGTDFATTVMGMPVNMPSHAHGQGYSDLQFLIPELIDRVQYRKGPYTAAVGDFATAGSASMDYFRVLNHPIAELTVGEYGYRRALLAGSPQTVGDGHLLYALEWAQYDGPWALPQDLAKLNALLRYSRGDRNNGWSLTAMAYSAQWDSTDQVPRRAITSGQVARYGYIDPSDGGDTYRYSLSGEWSAQDNDHWTRAHAYVIGYDLDLFSNFTYCTLGCGPGEPGDQFEQADRRVIYGMDAARTWYGDWSGRDISFTLGVQSRYDDIRNVGLYATTKRQRWGTVSQDKVREGSFSIYGESEVQWTEKFRSVIGLREDFYRFDVNSGVTPENSGSTRASITSPKLSLIFGPWNRTEYYVSAGYGFHSNDARGVTMKVNPDFRDSGFGDAVDSSTPLVRAKGYEVGVRSAIVPGLQTTLSLWQLDLASELLFVGDAGVTEPSFPSRRQGIEWANYWTPTRSVAVDADFAWSRARYTRIDAGTSGDYIPGALEKTASVGVVYDDGGDWSGGLRLRYFGSRPLIEDNTVRSPSSTLVNLRLGYKLDRKLKLSLDVLNLFDRKVSDIDYYYASRLSGEAAPVDDIHTHPAEPRMVRFTLRVGL
ncbi:MAG: TonB-dependent receptor [Methylobacillus sp.]|nr:TonB-dependent receptor [Methylobacillus sp.]